MMIDVNAPCCMPLSLVRLEGEGGPSTAVLGVALKYPIVQLSAYARPVGLVVTGARAPLAHEQATRFLQHHHLEARAEVAIEWAPYSQMGLGSDSMLGLSLAGALARLYGLPAEACTAPALALALGLGPEHALHVWGMERGGWLLVGTQASAGAGLTPAQGVPPCLRHYPLAHKDREAWAFPFFLPRVPPETPPTFEHDNEAALLRAAPLVSPESGRVLNDELWPALENDDLPRAATALHQLQSFTHEALARAGAPVRLNPDEQAVLDLLRDNGALWWGRSLTGLALFGFARGSERTVKLREALMKHVGFFGGTVMAGVTDPDGARFARQDRPPEDPASSAIGPRVDKT